MKCPYCKKNIPNHVDYCPYCGRRQQTGRRKENNPLSIIGKVALCLILLTVPSICVIVFHFGKNHNFITLIETKSASAEEKIFDEDNIGEIYYQEIDEEHVTGDENEKYIDNEILLVATEGTTYSEIEKIIKKKHGKIVGWIEQTGDYQIQFEEVYSEEELQNIIDELCKNPKIQRADINYVFTVSNDSENVTGDEISTGIEGEFQYGSQWKSDLQNFLDCEGLSWGLEAISTVQAWDVLNQNKQNPVRVGLIDAGFDEDHEDLGFAQIFYNTQENDHGTHVAGTMAAKSDNDLGICGVYPYGDNNLYGVSAQGAYDYSQNQGLISSSMFLKIAYSELILRDVKVINSSLGFNYKLNDISLTDQKVKIETESSFLGDFLNRLLKLGYDFVLINAAGNDSNSNKNIEYPSTYSWWLNAISEDEYPDVYNRIIVVGSVDNKYNISFFSNNGLDENNKNRVDIYAPGEVIFSTVSGNNYQNQYVSNEEIKFWSGTSMAAPHVSGVAAMVWTANNSLTGAQVKNIICNSISSRSNSCNMIDAYIAVSKAIQTAGINTGISDDLGGLLCWVVDQEDENIKIENATVIAVNQDTGDKYTSTTDKYGHFELFVPEGIYTLSVEAEGYDLYTETDISVKNSQVYYLDKDHHGWIKLAKTIIVDNKIQEKLTNTVWVNRDSNSVGSSYAVRFYDEEHFEICEEGRVHWDGIYEIDNNNIIFQFDEGYSNFQGQISTTDNVKGYANGIYNESDNTISMISDISNSGYVTSVTLIPETEAGESVVGQTPYNTYSWVFEDTIENALDDTSFQISEEEALQLAQDATGVKEGDLTVLGSPQHFVVNSYPTKDNPVYTIYVRVPVDNHSSTYGIIYVDANTGEVWQEGE